MLKVSLDRFEKIEIIQQPYIVSGIEYNGIICITTQQKDFAGINLNQNSQFFSFDVLSDGMFNSPDYDSINDTRTTSRHNLLFWDPDLELTPGHPHTLTFYTADSKGDYLVYVRGIKDHGEARFYGSCRIRIE